MAYASPWKELRLFGIFILYIISMYAGYHFLNQWFQARQTPGISSATQNPVVCKTETNARTGAKVETCNNDPLAFPAITICNAAKENKGKGAAIQRVPSPLRLQYTKCSVNIPCASTADCNFANTGVNGLVCSTTTKTCGEPLKQENSATTKKKRAELWKKTNQLWDEIEQRLEIEQEAQDRMNRRRDIIKLVNLWENVENIKAAPEEIQPILRYKRQTTGGGSGSASEEVTGSGGSGSASQEVTGSGGSGSASQEVTGSGGSGSASQEVTGSGGSGSASEEVTGPGGSGSESEEVTGSGGYGYGGYSGYSFSGSGSDYEYEFYSYYGGGELEEGQCTSAKNCESGEICFYGFCELAESCVFDTDCFDSALICKDSICTQPTGRECFSSADCDIGFDCTNTGKCEIGDCKTDGDCYFGATCEPRTKNPTKSICKFGCFDDFDCPLASQVCNLTGATDGFGSCVAKPAKSKCKADTDCEADAAGDSYVCQNSFCNLDLSSECEAKITFPREHEGCVTFNADGIINATVAGKSNAMQIRVVIPEPQLVQTNIAGEDQFVVNFFNPDGVTILLHPPQKAFLNDKHEGVVESTVAAEVSSSIKKKEEVTIVEDLGEGGYKVRRRDGKIGTVKKEAITIIQYAINASDAENAQVSASPGQVTSLAITRVLSTFEKTKRLPTEAWTVKASLAALPSVPAPKSDNSTATHKSFDTEGYEVDRTIYLFIYYDSLSWQLVTEVQTYQLFNAFGDWTAIAGFFVGIAFWGGMTMVQMFELAVGYATK